MSWDAVIFDFEDTLVDISRGKPRAGGPAYYSGARGVPPVTDRSGRPVVDAMSLLIEAGVPVAVITSSPEAAMRRWFQEQQFALPVAIVGFHDTVLHRPSPHPLLEALNQIGVTPSTRVLSVGDSADDITAARRAGLTAGTVRERVPATNPPDIFLPFVESFFDDERVFGLLGDLEREGPSVSLQLELPGHVCRIAGRLTDKPRNRLSQLLVAAREGTWAPELVQMARTLVEHAVGAEREGLVVTWVPSQQVSHDPLRQLMLRLKEETDLTISPLLRYLNEVGEQAGRERTVRATAAPGSMEARGKVDLSGRTVLVFDDVRDSGGTLAEAARALAAAGAARVVGLAFAQEAHRGERPEAAYGPLAPVLNAAHSPPTAGGRQAADAGLRGAAAEADAGAGTVLEPRVVRSRRVPAGPPTRAPVSPERMDTPAAIKNKFPRAYQRWTSEEDALLARLYRQGKDLATMCAALGRQPKSVETRIRRVEIDIDEADFAVRIAQPAAAADEAAMPAASPEDVAQDAGAASGPNASQAPTSAVQDGRQAPGHGATVGA